MNTTTLPLPDSAPILLGRIKTGTTQPYEQDPAHDLLEEAVLVLLRQRYPAYLKLNGYQVRCALNRAFVRFLLERTRGNQARAAELAGFNRNTLRTLIRNFQIDWKRYVGK
ncbi:helix-turn-helix domain-containing protein [Hyphomicrobium sp.]|uniref:helix-turn-helix domain-containing protein n=1 Tax=Hyphomicrobium sp. TaxID=82 RepID=UPI002E3802A4|nr:helix-turn-helix domain-containing protein [Hyphomicrobium sp.]HEX2842168.1 helix-turn-helix domain-containing protein [Hyphomicrobium sp.]